MKQTWWTTTVKSYPNGLGARDRWGSPPMNWPYAIKMPMLKLSLCPSYTGFNDAAAILAAILNFTLPARDSECLPTFFPKWCLLDQGPSTVGPITCGPGCFLYLQNCQVLLHASLADFGHLATKQSSYRHADFTSGCRINNWPDLGPISRLVGLIVLEIWVSNTEGFKRTSLVARSSRGARNICVGSGVNLAHMSRKSASFPSSRTCASHWWD
jgi:hypothetical protein